MVMSIKRGNNHGANPWPNQDERGIERAFLRLGDILGDIADDLENKGANTSEDTARNKDTISTSQKTLDVGENKDGECNDGQKRHICHE